MISRRKSLELISGIGGSLLVPFTLNADVGNKTDWLKEFEERWEKSDLYTKEVLAAMPDKYLIYQPTSEVMSFAKQLSHLGWGNAIYSGVLNGEDPIKEPEELTRISVQSYLDVTSKGIKECIEAIDEQELFTHNHEGKDLTPWNDFSVSSLLLLAYHHTAHHRAQAIVYLRLKGIVPPKYRF